MRLYLASQDLGDYAHVARELAGDSNKAALIRNAQDSSPAEERNWSTPQKRKMFEDAGFEFGEIDLRDYFGKSKELQEKLQEFGSIWVAGGNTFILRRAFAKSGLDTILTELLKQDKILYGGWSAGAMIMAPDIKSSDWGDSDSPHIVPDGYDPEIIWDGLSQVPFYIVPHIGNKQFNGKPEDMAKSCDSQNVPYYAITDSQVVVVNGDSVKLLP